MIVKIWSPFTGQLIRNLAGHTKVNSDIAWSTDSVYLASASDDQTIRIWDVESVGHRVILCISPVLTGSVLKGVTSRVLKGHSAEVFCVNYNHTSTLLVSGSCAGDIKIWNAAKGTKRVSLLNRFRLLKRVPSGKCMKTLDAHYDYVTAVHFNRDSALIVSCSLDRLMYEISTNPSHRSNEFLQAYLEHHNRSVSEDPR